MCTGAYAFCSNVHCICILTRTTDVDILEEIAFLKTLEGGKVNLDILPTSTKVIAQ